MKLTVVFLLVTLMVCCYSDTAVEDCHLNDIFTKFLTGSSEDYMKAIAPFSSSADMTEAASRMKQCAPETPEQELLARKEVLKNILAKCAEMPKLPLV
ncbi:secretoglobin family 1D member 2-like [Anolis sagrei]|uniref:secretoglobin family 1D member 2-like n=1 Tax=Anolis sagrei TaxID=38937 RepID=UPI0035230479